MRIARMLVPVALAGLVLVGCAKTPSTTASQAPADNGVKALSATEILAKAQAAMTEAGSFHTKGDISQDGQKISIDLKFKGKDAAGSVTIPDGTIKIVRVGNDLYLQGDEAFWKKFGGAQGDTIAVLLKDKWVKVKADNPQFSEFSDMADPANLLKPSGTPEKGDEKVINGQATIGVKDGDEGTMYIATTGKPYPIELQGPSGGGSVDFSEYGATFDEIKAPDAGTVVDLSAIMGGS